MSDISIKMYCEGNYIDIDFDKNFIKTLKNNKITKLPNITINGWAE